MGCFVRGLLFLFGAALLLPGACFGALGAKDTATGFYLAGGAVIVVAVVISLGSGTVGGTGKSGGRRRVSKAEDLMRILERDEQREHED
jgi:hypothetical protein